MGHRMQMCRELVMGHAEVASCSNRVNTFSGPTACHLQTTKRLSTWLCSSPSPDRSVSITSQAPVPVVGGVVRPPFLCLMLLWGKTLGFQMVWACAVKIDGLGCTPESKATKAQPGARRQHKCRTGMHPDSGVTKGPLLLTVMGSWNPVLRFMVEI